jgi:uncharacterized protein (TIGR02145 family)
MKKTINYALVLFLLVGAYSCKPKKEDPPVDSTVTVKDIDGNVYNVVTIGTQTWLKENLKVTRYRNGDPIPYLLDGTDWWEATYGARCYHTNDSISNSKIYGSLYNYHAVVDSRNICPVGYHIPSSAEWNTLIAFLGGESVAGGAMKSTTIWNSPNTGASNSSGFTALPGGDRYETQGGFNYLGLRSGFWSNVSVSTKEATSIYIDHDATYAKTYPSLKGNGFSVRCIKD